jgi:hypothetical protein
MPASVYSTLQTVGARALVAGRDFSWQVGAAGATAPFPTQWFFPRMSRHATAEVVRKRAADAT